MEKREVVLWWVLTPAVLLIFLSAISACGQPICSTIGSSLQVLWRDLPTHTPAIGATAASIGVLVAVYFHSQNLKATRLSNSAKMVMDAFSRFESDAMRKHRKKFSADLATNQSAVNLMDETPVLDFFEDVGHQTRRGILDHEMVASAFGWWVSGYFHAVTAPENHFAQIRENLKHPDFYWEFEWLYSHCVAPQTRERARHFSPTVNQGSFLSAEAALAV